MYGRRRGGFVAILITIIVIVLLAASGWLAAEAMKKRSFEQGRALLERGDYTQAAALLEKAERFSLRPDAKILLALATARSRLGEKDAAKSALEKVVSIEPANAEARYELGKIYVGQKNYKAAKSEIKALEDIGTGESREYADELKSSIQTGAVKGFFNDLLKKVLPGIPDALKNVMPDSGSDN